MKASYSVEKNVQILIALMKEHGVKRVVVSPGSTNICFVASIQSDSDFTLYSCVDERSAAYMACGIAAESGEPVALSCTGATASRNYIPGITEAFYRKLPVLAITSTRPLEEIGQDVAQVVDRTVQQKDTYLTSVYLPVPHSPNEEWGCVVNANKALLELSHHGGGPVHINLMTEYQDDFSVRALPPVRVIKRFTLTDEFPSLGSEGVFVYVGSHGVWSKELVRAVDLFCELYNGVVLCDPTSNYPGKYGVFANLLTHQKDRSDSHRSLGHLIQMGTISGSYMAVFPKRVWRVSPDGEVRDTFKKLEAVFEMDELSFFESMIAKHRGKPAGTTTFEEWNASYQRLLPEARELVDGLPFSSLWIAARTSKSIPGGSVIQLGILNSLRSWTYFGIPNSVICYANTGGFGIDGGMSALIGSSLIAREKLHYCVLGDLSFFYDLNSLGNRHIGGNVRILLVNNGLGAEFKLKQTLSMKAGMGDTADQFVAAAGHFGNKSHSLVRHFANDLGFEYLSASNKAEFDCVLDRFLTPKPCERPMILEAFVNSKADADALDELRNIERTPKGNAKRAVKQILGEKGVLWAKRTIGR